MSTMIVCPGCGTELDYRDIESADNPQCTICGKMLLAELLSKKQQVKNSGSLKLEQAERMRTSTRKMGQKLQQLGDDDLFGELEPFSLDDERYDDESEELSPTSSVRKLDSETSKKRDLDDIELDDDEVFANPMEKSSLMKKLKEDQDLFGSLDG